MSDWGSDDDQDDDTLAWGEEEDDIPMSNANGAAPATGATSPHRTNASTNHERKADYVAMSESDMERTLQRTVHNLQSLLAISQWEASLLLRSHGWSEEKVTQLALEGKDALLQRVGAVPTAEEVAATASAMAANQKSKAGEILCRICDDQVPIREARAIACKHYFCDDCWLDYLQHRLTLGKHAVLSTCPSFKCNVIIPDSIFYALLSPLEVAKYKKQLIRSFVEDNRQMIWCPAASCDNAVRGAPSTRSVKCKCGFAFCFGCSEEDHAPASCSQMSAWLDKCQNESETAHWIIINTKRCPKCTVRIEKNQGCNHMSCQSCKYEFCWVCDGPWTEHGPSSGGFYKCNKFNPKKMAAAAAANAKKGPGNQKEEAQAELGRYLHYYQRYHNHDQAKKFAVKHRESAEARMREMQTKMSDSSASWIDQQYLLAAVEQVQECRRVLKHTYVFGYYLPIECTERPLFEYLQQQLETSTEHLSELSEMPLEKIDKARVVNYTRVTENFMNNLLRGIEDGLANA